MKRTVPEFQSDQEAEAFLNQDLSDLDFSQFKLSQFEFESKTERFNMRLPASLLTALKEAAATKGVPYQRYIRQVLELAINDRSRT